MPTTSDEPEPCIVLQTNTSTTHQPRVLHSASLPSQEAVMKFFIGLRLLGEEKQQRYLTYLAAVLNRQKAKKETTNDHSV